MNTSQFIKRFRTMCDELEEVNAEADSNVYKLSLSSVAFKYDIPELNGLDQG